jgi:hypothetical protein
MHLDTTKIGDYAKNMVIGFYGNVKELNLSIFAIKPNRKISQEILTQWRELTKLSRKKLRMRQRKNKIGSFFLRAICYRKSKENTYII